MHEMKRTVTCGELNAAAAGGKVTLNGWVARLRDHGGITFLDLRDRYGVTQVVFDVSAEASADAPGGLAAAVADLKLEHCVAVRGTVRRRPPDMVNRELATGAIEVAGEQLAVLSTCATLPFMVSDQPGAHTEAREELRLKHRYLDLRSATMQRNLAMRHRAAQAMRTALNSRRFLEIETPTLMRSTPEGARDFVVPSRLNPGSFYALPQSPQILKQLLMLSGCDRYYQLARCYRDEDARGDRQPEFTQLDFEMSFVDQDDVLAVLEAAFAAAFRDGIGHELPLPFPRITFHDAMNRYGSDRPDLRYDLELREFTELARAGGFGIFKKAAERGDTVKALRAPGLARYSRKQIEELEEHAKTYGAAGMAWMKCGAGGLESGVSRFYQAQQAEIHDALGAEAGDLLLMVAAPWRTACTALGAVRTELARREDLADEGAFRPCFVTDFPLFAWNEDERRWDAEHHMFVMPQKRFLENIEQDPGRGARRVVRRRNQRRGAGHRLHPDPRSGVAAQRVRDHGHVRRRGNPALRVHAGRVPLRRAPPWRRRHRLRPHRHADGTRSNHPRRHCIPQEHLGRLADGRLPRPSRPTSTRRTPPAGPRSGAPVAADLLPSAIRRRVSRPA